MTQTSRPPPNARCGRRLSTLAQTCLATERIYVVEPLFEAFTLAFVRRTQAMRLGNAPDFEHDMGSLINQDHLEQVSAHVDDARDKGAAVLAGGRRREDLGELLYEPTILTGVTPEMDCYADETFGPVVSVYPVIDEDVQWRGPTIPTTASTPAYGPLTMIAGDA